MDEMLSTTFEAVRFSRNLVQRPADWAEAWLDGNLADFVQSWNPFNEDVIYDTVYEVSCI